MNMPLQNILLWHKDYFKLIKFKNKQVADTVTNPCSASFSGGRGGDQGAYSPQPAQAKSQGDPISTTKLNMMASTYNFRRGEA
jgi:hypothetical protein